MYVSLQQAEWWRFKVWGQDGCCCCRCHATAAAHRLCLMAQTTAHLRRAPRSHTTNSAACRLSRSPVVLICKDEEALGLRSDELAQALVRRRIARFDLLQDHGGHNHIGDCRMLQEIHLGWQTRAQQQEEQRLRVMAAGALTGDNTRAAMCSSSCGNKQIEECQLASAAAAARGA